MMLTSNPVRPPGHRYVSGAGFFSAFGARVERDEETQVAQTIGQRIDGLNSQHSGDTSVPVKRQSLISSLTRTSLKIVSSMHPWFGSSVSIAVDQAIANAGFPVSRQIIGSFCPVARAGISS